MAWTNGAIASCIAMCAAALAKGNGSPPASNSARAFSAVIPFAASQARAERLRLPSAASGENTGAMPPVSTPSSASAGPGSAMVVSATWRIPSAAAAASRAACAASAKPGSGVPVGGAGQVLRHRSNGAEQARQRSGRRLRPAAQDGGERTCDRQRRIRAILNTEDRQQASQVRYADREAGCRGRGQRQRGDRGLHRFAERGRVEAAAGIVEEARFSTYPGAPSPHPCQIDAHGAP